MPEHCQVTEGFLDGRRRGIAPNPEQFPCFVCFHCVGFPEFSRPDSRKCMPGRVMVPGTGLEPVSLAAADFKISAKPLQIKGMMSNHFRNCEQEMDTKLLIIRHPGKGFGNGKRHIRANNRWLWGRPPRAPLDPAAGQGMIVLSANNGHGSDNPIGAAIGRNVSTAAIFSPVLIGSRAGGRKAAGAPSVYQPRHGLPPRLITGKQVQNLTGASS
jgi:hypothetical protein